MADYKYRQTLNGGGYVEYNVNPDFSESIKPGDSFTVDCRFTCSSSNISIITAEVYKAANRNYSNSVGVVGMKSVSVSKNTVSSNIQINCTIPASKGDLFFQGSQRNAGCYICFEVSGPTSPGVWQTTAISSQYWNILKYRLDAKVIDYEFVRCSSNGALQNDGTRVKCKFKISINSSSSISDIRTSKIEIVRDGRTDGTINLSTSTLNSALSANGYNESVPILFSSFTFNTGDTYVFKITIGDIYNSYTYEYTMSRAFAIMHLSGAKNGGVAFGGFSPSTDSNPRFDCYYPAYFNNGIYGVTDFEIGEVETGGTWIDGKIIYRLIVEFGTCQAGAVTYFDMGINGARINAVVSLTGIGFNNGVYYPIPIVSTADAGSIRSLIADVSNSRFRINTGSLASIDRGFVIMHYTKS